LRRSELLRPKKQAAQTSKAVPRFNTQQFFSARCSTSSSSLYAGSSALNALTRLAASAVSVVTELA